MYFKSSRSENQLEVIPKGTARYQEIELHTLKLEFWYIISIAIEQTFAFFLHSFFLYMIARFVKGTQYKLHDPIIDKDVSFVVVLQNNKLR